MSTKAPGQADSDDFPLDSSERESAALSSAGALCSPEDVIADWGDGNRDHDDDRHAVSSENTDTDTPFSEFYTFERRD